MVLTSSASVAPVSSFSSADSIASRPSRLSSKNVWWNWLRSTLLMASATDAIDGCEQLIGIERLDQPAGRTGRLAFLLLFRIRFGGQHQNRNPAVTGELANLAHHAAAIHSRHVEVSQHPIG